MTVAVLPNEETVRRTVERAMIMNGFDVYQLKANATAVYDEGRRIIYPALGVAGEAGEIAEKIKKLLRDHDGVVSHEFRQAVKREIGDELWYLAALARDLGLTLGECAVDNLDKVEDRKARGVLHGNGDNR